LHGEVGVRRFFTIHATATVFPLVAGVILFGWRALAAVALVLAGTGVGLAVWRRVGARGRRIGVARGVWLAILLALALPPHLASTDFPGSPVAGWAWPILPATGLALAVLMWVFAGIGSGRVHPVPVIYLFVVVLFQPMLTPHFVLHRQRVLSGNVIDAKLPPPLAPGEAAPVQKDPWTNAFEKPARDALYQEPASERLITFTTGRQTPARAALSLEELLRDDMPPLEDLIVGGHPGPIGSARAVAVIMGGLFLLRRGLLDFRVPLLICLAAAAALLLLPIPVAVTENVRHWRTLAAHHGVGWPVAITFVSYELMAGPLLFVAFYLANAPGIRPLTRRGRAAYAVLIGAGAAALQLYLDVSYGPYLALLIAGLFTPLLDRVFKPRPLV
jgi:Na+-translocating ferredoxin:NAD+ oxidoreductase RnfD subunit